MSLSSTTEKLRAHTLNRAGLEHFERWEMETAITLFQEAVRLDGDEPDYYLNLARANVRMGDYREMLHTLGEYLHIETDKTLINRFEALFRNGLDDVEKSVTETMRAENIKLEVIGAAIQMWLEYRVTIGKRYLDMSRPEAWAAALDYTVRKVNFEGVPLEQLTEWYHTEEDAVHAFHSQLVDILDVMPCDYRYFRSDDNPLDKLVEAAAMLEDLESRFRASE